MIPPARWAWRPTLSPPASRIYQVPLSYRGYELAGASEWLIGTMDHSVLGKRWVYDACADPVYVKALATAIITGQQEARVDRRRRV